jgi:hypothetical protein
MAESDIDDLLHKFRKAAISYGAAIAKGNVRATNRSTERLQELDRELAIRGQEAALLDLLYEESQWIQVCAAVGMLVLEFAEETAMQTLRQIAAKGEPLPSLEAQTALLGWATGGFQSRTGLLAEEDIPEKAVPTLRQEVDLPKAVEEIKEVLAKVKKIPRRVRFKDIQQFETMEDRFFAVDRTIGAILGMNEDSIDFCPDKEPPSRDEVLAWLWVIHPEYKAAILELGSERVRTAVLESEGTRDEGTRDSHLY